MFAVVFFAQTLALVVFHLAALVVVRGARHAGARTRDAVRAAALLCVVVGPLVLGLTDASGGTFLGAQLGLTLGFLGLVVTEPGTPHRPLLVTHTLSTFVLGHFLVWRGLSVDGQATPVLRYVLTDFAHQLTFPVLGLLGDGNSAFGQNVRSLVVGATTGIAERPLLPLATLGYVVWVALARQATDAAVPVGARALARSGAASVLLVVGFVVTRLAPASAWPAGVGVALGATLTPPLMVEGARALAPVAGRLVAPRVAALVGLGAVVVLPELLVALAALGCILLFVPTDDDGMLRGAGSPLGSLIRGAAALLTPLALVCAVGYLRTAPHLPAGFGPTCADVAITRRDDLVVFTESTGVSVGIEVEEHPLPGSVARAEAACARRGRHLCRSDELFLGCACDLGGDHASRGLVPVPPAALVRRAERTCGPATDPADCRSEHGLEGQLGGRSEVCADGPYTEVFVVAGPNRVQRENWMAHCGYRSLVSSVSLAHGVPDFVGYRCCADVAPTTP